MGPTSSYFETVYYSDFWYSRHFRHTESSVGANVVQEEVVQHRFRLRLLSLFFDTLYVPRTHLITSVFPDQYKIADHVISSTEIAVLLDSGSIRISSSPGLDAYQDNLRILERQTETTDALYPSDRGYVSRIPVTRDFIVDTKQESLGNMVTFPQYGDLLTSYNAEIGRKYKEVVRRSGLRDVPFFHERFLKLIREEVPSDIFASIWRNTNSIYLTSGAPEHKGFIAYFNEEIESDSFRFEPYSIDRYLFSPSTLYTFLGIFLDTSQVSRLLYDDIRITHRPFLQHPLHPATSLFRHEYQKVARAVSQITRVGSLKGLLDQQGLKLLFELVLDSEEGRVGKVVQEVLADTERATKAHGELVGLLGSVVNSGSKFGGRFLRERRRRRRFPAICELVDRLRDATRER